MISSLKFTNTAVILHMPMKGWSIVQVGTYLVRALFIVSLYINFRQLTIGMRKNDNYCHILLKLLLVIIFFYKFWKKKSIRNWKKMNPDAHTGDNTPNTPFSITYGSYKYCDNYYNMLHKHLRIGNARVRSGLRKSLWKLGMLTIFSPKSLGQWLIGAEMEAPLSETSRFLGRFL